MHDIGASLDTLQHGYLIIPAAAFLFGALVLFAAERRIRNQGAVHAQDMRATTQSVQLLFDCNPLPMWVFEPASLRFVAVNDAAVVTYGYTREQFGEMTLLDLRPPEDHDELRQLVCNPDKLSQGRIWHHRRADGTHFDVAIYARALVHSGRQAVLVAAIDVSAQRAAEADLRRARAFLNTIFDHVPVSVTVKEMQSGRYVLVNQTAARMLGLPRDQIVGHRPDDFEPGEAAIAARLADLARLRAGETVAVSDHVLRTPGGDLRSVTTKRVVIKESEAEPAYVVTVVDDHTDLAAARDRIAFLDTHDALTGLRNRIAFMNDLDTLLAAAPTQSDPVILVSMDISNFTQVNDVGGSIAGDEILKAIAAYLKADDSLALVGRVGGDEFMVVLTRTRPDAAVEFAHHLNDVVRRCGAAFREGITIGVKAGLALYPSDGMDAMTLMTNAESAQHRAKASSCQHLCFFEAAVDQRLREQRSLLRDLDHAMRNGELVPYYQPQARSDGTIYGFEALLRWQHPQRGMIPPGDFIPAAEKSGQIIEIGEMMLRRVCTDAAAWPTPLDVAVNMSVVQFEQADLPGCVANILAETGLPASRLEIEITESMLVGDTRRALRILHELKSLGLRIAMDDFGTGYSSLAYLQSFPFDRLKIDRQFVAGLETSVQSTALVKAVIGLGHGLGLPVIAEGVETVAQLEMLRRLGCDEVQGYLIGRPQPLPLDSPLFDHETAPEQLFRRAV